MGRPAFREKPGVFQIVVSKTAEIMNLNAVAHRENGST